MRYVYYSLLVIVAACCSTEKAAKVAEAVQAGADAAAPIVTATGGNPLVVTGIALVSAIAGAVAGQLRAKAAAKNPKP